VRDAFHHHPRPRAVARYLGEPSAVPSFVPLPGSSPRETVPSRPISFGGVGIAISDTRTSGGFRDPGHNALTVVPTSSRPSAKP